MFGKLIEQELLGAVKQERPSFGQLRELETEYLGYRQSLEYVKAHQRGDPFHPKRFFPKNLIEALRASPELKITIDEELGYYTAVGSAFDRYHGIDAFFEYRPEGKRAIMVTIDVTTNPNKDDYKADVVLSIPRGGLDPSDTQYHYLINKYAQQIREELLTKVS